MKTNEFIKKLEKLNLNVQEHQDTILIRRNVGGYWIAYISKTKKFTFNAAFQDFEELYTETKSKLLDLIMAYTKTPIKEREEPKKYRLRFKAAEYLIEPHRYYLNRDKDGFFFSTVNHTETLQTIFTQEEIDEMPLKLVGLFDKIEVENE